VARAAGVRDYKTCPADIVLAEMRAGKQAGARPIPIGSDHYPASLAQVSDAPPILWSLGDPSLLQRPIVALVGARNASSLGTRMARRLAAGLADAGFVVASGLARGVDTAAHLAALDGGTIAVLAGGVDVVYPAENAVLAQEIAERGLRLSEQPIGLHPRSRQFPARNRIISGLARTVVVVEAAAKSGSLITARTALDQGRDVMAVPGHPFDARAAGCNMLIRDGAALVRSAQDVIETIGTAADTVGTGPVAADTEVVEVEDSTRGNPNPPRRSLKDTSALHQQILDRLGPSPLAEDQLIRDLGLPAGNVASGLVTLELEGRVERRAGGLLSKL